MSATKAVPFEDYQRIDAVNWSTLKEAGKSAKHYLHRTRVPREDSTRFALGRGCHTATFEPDRFMVDYACFKGARRAGKEWEAFEATHKRDTILKLTEYQTCLAVRDAVRAHPVAAEYLKAGSAEHTMVWPDPTTGLHCKGRVDWVSQSKPAIVDLKTTNDISADRFAATVARMGYHGQGAWYQAGYAAAHGEVLPVVIIAVEIEAPYDVAVYRLDPDALLAGEREWQRLIQLVATCKSTGVWPGGYPQETSLALPRWALPYDDGDDDFSAMGLVVGSDA